MDAYHAPYTKHHRYWTGLGLLIRCCLFTIFGTTNSTIINILSRTIAVNLLQVIRLASSGKVYRNKAVGLLELFYLSNLAFLTTVLLVNDTLCAAITVSISLSFIVFVGTVVHHLYLETRKNNFMYQRIKETFNNCRKKHGTLDNTIIHEQESSTSYFDLRESLIDSTVYHHFYQYFGLY